MLTLQPILPAKLSLKMYLNVFHGIYTHAEWVKIIVCGNQQQDTNKWIKKKSMKSNKLFLFLFPGVYTLWEVLHV